MGRPSDYTPEIADAICERLSGGESLRAICKDDDMPDAKTVWRWLRKFDAFRPQYAQAREAQAEVWVDELIEIADDGSNDTYVDDEGRVTVNHDVIARSRLRVDTRKWALSKLKPGTYGDKIEQTHKGQIQVSLSGADASL